MKSDRLGNLTGLPTDGQSILSLAARSLFDVLLKGIKSGKITEVYTDSYFNTKKYIKHKPILTTSPYF